MMAGEGEFVKAKVHPKFLLSNATNHIKPFGAVAELIDNAYDPDVNAKKLFIDKEVISSKECLVFTDNGRGLCLEKLTKMLSWGYSEKENYETKYHMAVGRYGSGFQSGAMRLAKDALVLSVCREEKMACVGLLSRSLYEERKLDEVVLPMVEFSLPDLQMTKSPAFQASLDAILGISPYHKEKELKAELRQLMNRPPTLGGGKGIGNKKQKTRSGTKIVLFNLNRLKLQTGAAPYELEFICQTSPSNTAQDANSQAEETRPPSDELSPRTENPQRERRDIRIRQMDAAVDSLTDPLPSQGSASSINKSRSLEYRLSLRAYCSVLYLIPRMDIYICGDKVSTLHMKNILEDPKSYTFSKDREQKRRRCEVLFGRAPKELQDYGVLFYHKNRLIRLFDKLRCQTKPSRRLGRLVGEGVVGVVDVTDVLEPIHNKQDFATDNLLYRNIMSTLSSKLEKYCEDVTRQEAPGPPSRPRGRGQGRLLSSPPGSSRTTHLNDDNAAPTDDGLQRPELSETRRTGSEDPSNRKRRSEQKTKSPAHEADDDDDEDFAAPSTSSANTRKRSRQQGHEAADDAEMQEENVVACSSRTQRARRGRPEQETTAEDAQSEEDDPGTQNSTAPATRLRTQTGRPEQEMVDHSSASAPSSPAPEVTANDPPVRVSRASTRRAGQAAETSALTASDNWAASSSASKERGTGRGGPRNSGRATPRIDKDALLLRNLTRKVVLNDLASTPSGDEAAGLEGINEVRPQPGPSVENEAESEVDHEAESVVYINEAFRMNVQKLLDFLIEERQIRVERFPLMGPDERVKYTLKSVLGFFNLSTVE